MQALIATTSDDPKAALGSLLKTFGLGAKPAIRLLTARPATARCIKRSRLICGAGTRIGTKANLYLENMEGTMEQKLLSRAEVSNIIGVSTDTVDSLAAKGYIRRLKIGARTLFDPKDVDRFIRNLIRKGAVLLVE